MIMRGIWRRTILEARREWGWLSERLAPHRADICERLGRWGPGATLFSDPSDESSPGSNTKVGLAGGCLLLPKNPTWHLGDTEA